MNNRLRRILGMAALIAATALPTLATDAMAHAHGLRGPARLAKAPRTNPFVPNIKAHTVQEKVLLVTVLHGLGADPRLLKHTVQEPPFMKALPPMMTDEPVIEP